MIRNYSSVQIIHFDLGFVQYTSIFHIVILQKIVLILKLNPLYFQNISDSFRVLASHVHLIFLDRRLGRVRLVTFLC